MLVRSWAVVSRVLVAAHATSSSTPASAPAVSWLCLANMRGLLCRLGAVRAPVIRASQKTPRAAGFFSSAQMGVTASAAERTAALTGTLRALLCFVDAQRAAVHLKAVQRLDGALRFRLRHVDEAEAARLAGLPVVDEFHRLHFAVTFKQGFHVLFGRIEGQIAHVDRRHPGLSLGNADSGEPHASV